MAWLWINILIFLPYQKGGTKRKYLPPSQLSWLHRLLLAAVSLTMSNWWGGGEVQDKATANLMLQVLCTHINTRNRAAQRA
jgi:hypothetical protein